MIPLPSSTIPHARADRLAWPGPGVGATATPVHGHEVIGGVIERRLLGCQHVSARRPASSVSAVEGAAVLRITDETCSSRLVPRASLRAAARRAAGALPRIDGHWASASPASGSAWGTRSSNGSDEFDRFSDRSQRVVPAPQLPQAERVVVQRAGEVREERVGGRFGEPSVDRAGRRPGRPANESARWRRAALWHLRFTGPEIVEVLGWPARRLIITHVAA